MAKKTVKEVVINEALSKDEAELVGAYRTMKAISKLSEQNDKAYDKITDILSKVNVDVVW